MENVIEIQGLSKTFRTPFTRRKVEAVKSLTLKVTRGEIFGFLGPNGAGKTTTIKVLTGLVRPTSGKVKVLGGDPEDIAIKARVGFLPEQPYFYDYLKPAELLDVFGRLFGMPHDLRRRRIEELLELTGIAYAKDRVLRKFSKGMLQRVGIAQALLNDPELVILDEPMSGLDPIGRKDVIDLIASLKAKGKTVFFSSHILSDVERLCDRVLILDKGVTKACGRISDLLSGQGDEKEVLAKVPEGVTLPVLHNLKRSEAIAPGVMRFVFASNDSDAAIASLLSVGISILAVSERRMTLEELVVGARTSPMQEHVS